MTIDPTMRNPLTPFTGPPDYDFMRLDSRLKATETRVVYVGVPDPDFGGQRRWWDLAGANGGKQGLDLAPHVTGLMQMPFKSLFSEGPYMLGSYYERTDFPKRILNIGVMVGNSFAPDTSFRYRMLEQRWWASWSESADGYLGVWTRTHGWRWLRVRMYEEPKTAMELDPVAFENNFMQWDMQIVACAPYWSKRIETNSWQNVPQASIQPPNAVDQFIEQLTGIPIVGALISDLLSAIGPIITGAAQAVDAAAQALIEPIIGTLTSVFGFNAPSWMTAAEHPLAGILASTLLNPGIDYGVGRIRLPNRGTMDAWPKFVATTPGWVWIQDGIGGPMVQLPLTTAADGAIIYIDTDPIARTLTGAADPVDQNYLSILGNSQLLDMLLGTTIDTQTEAIWKRFNGQGFANPIPPRTLATLQVQHSDPNGKITAYMPQHFRMAYA